ncbi:MAG: hypothetical protein V4671_00590 [Armatimonadota bacterium]
MELEQAERFIREICARLGEEYAGFHTISAGKLDGQNCPEVCVHVTGPTGIYHLLVGEERTTI